MITRQVSSDAKFTIIRRAGPITAWYGSRKLNSALLIVEYPFRRSLGPVLSAFFTGLREGIVIGIRRKNGTVLVPPTEYDPETSEPLDDLVEVGQAGVVTAWAWVAEPRPNQPLSKPFAWALVRLDGADTAMLSGIHSDTA